MKNYIFESASEGVFVYMGGNSMIYENTIYSNYDGIIVDQSYPDIKFNTIRNNKENGIIVMKNSDPQIQFNTLKNNNGLGLYIQDISEPNIYNNKIMSNQIDFASENEASELLCIKRKNSLGSNVYHIPTKKCVIF